MYHWMFYRYNFKTYLSCVNKHISQKQWINYFVNKCIGWTMDEFKYFYEPTRVNIHYNKICIPVDYFKFS